MLANSMLGLLPSYDMQVVWYPQYICEFIDRCIRGFIWRGNNSRRVHLVNWDVITEPKEGGGLRVRVARNHNINILLIFVEMLMGEFELTNSFIFYFQPSNQSY